MERISFNQKWQFAKLPDGIFPATTEPVWETVTLPHTWYSDGDPYQGLAVYRKTVTVDPAWRKAFLEFNGADQVCRVFVNGRSIGQHKGGYSRFRFPVPKEALKSGELHIEVCLTNSPNQEVSPNFGDFTVFGGLYRDVNLLITGEDHFDYCYYGTDGILARTDIGEDGSGTVLVEPHVCTEKKDAVIAYTLIGPDGHNVGGCSASIQETPLLTVSNPVLWNGKNGVGFYRLRAVLTVHDMAVDETTVRIGFRQISMSPDKGLRLNGRHVRIRGVAKHQDHSGVFSAVTERQIEEDFALIREIGANAVRLSHYQHAQYTYDLCDEGGYLVWAEIPMLRMTENTELCRNAEEQLRELILQNLHHPSIFCWGIQNEIAMFKDTPFMHEKCRELTNLAKSIDPNRLVTAANLNSVEPSSELNAITDMIGYNLYFGWYYGEMPDYSEYLDTFHEACPGMPLGISEYGVDANPSLHAEEPGVKDYSEEFQALFHETVYPILQSKDYLWGSFVWNMFDFSSARRSEGGVKFLNTKGLVNYDRSLRKDAFYYYKAVWSQEPFIHICSKRFVRRCREVINVKIYTNQPCITLLVNGVECMSLPNNGNGTVVFSAVMLQPGENVVHALCGDFHDACVFERVEEEERNYCLPDEEKGTVRNWFLGEEQTVREGYYSIMDSVGDVLNGARSVLEKFVPALLPALEQDQVPLTLSMKNLIPWVLKDEPDTISRIQEALQEIKK